MTEGSRALTYTWAVTGTPPAPVSFSANATNAAKNTTATFSAAGAYTFQVTITDAGGLSTTSAVVVNVSQTLAAIAVTPGTASLNENATQQFSAIGHDQFGAAAGDSARVHLVRQRRRLGRPFGGLYTAPGSGNAGDRHAHRRQRFGQRQRIGYRRPMRPRRSPTPAAASPAPVTGTTATLSVLGADDGGESNLTYSWATTGSPPAPVIFSANGTNAAKNATATFTAAGSYNFQVTITDAEGLSTTSTRLGASGASLFSIVTTPALHSIPVNTTQQFTAVGLDQFGNTLSAQPTFQWSVAGGGTITQAGLYTAPASTGSASVTAAAGGVQRVHQRHGSRQPGGGRAALRGDRHDRAALRERLPERVHVHLDADVQARGGGRPGPERQRDGDGRPHHRHVPQGRLVPLPGGLQQRLGRATRRRRWN